MTHESELSGKGKSDGVRLRKAMSGVGRSRAIKREVATAGSSASNTAAARRSRQLTRNKKKLLGGRGASAVEWAEMAHASSSRMLTVVKGSWRLMQHVDGAVWRATWEALTSDGLAGGRRRANRLALK